MKTAIINTNRKHFARPQKNIPQKGLNIFLLVVLLVIAKVNYAQQDTWDIPTTEVLIAHNKTNYADHQQLTANQVVSQGTVSGWKSTTDKFKSVSDLVNKRLTSAFIVVADATTLYSIYGQLSQMTDYESKAIQMAYKHPWLVPVLTSEEAKILQSGNDLIDYLGLIALTYGELNKMKVSARRTIFREIDLQMAVLRGRCYSLYQMMNRFDIATQIKNSKGGQYVNKDAQLVKDILKTIK